jgi:hypothetical protein
LGFEEELGTVPGLGDLFTISSGVKLRLIFNGSELASGLTET